MNKSFEKFSPENLIYLRNYSNLSQEAFAHKYEISISTLRKWEQGVAKMNNLSWRGMLSYPGIQKLITEINPPPQHQKL